MAKTWHLGLIFIYVFLSACAPRAQAEIAAPTLTPTAKSSDTPAPTASSTAPAPTETPLIQNIPGLSTLADVVSVELVLTGEPELDSNAYLYKLTYLSDGFTVLGYFAAPKDYLERAAPYPILVYNRGGHSDFGAVPAKWPASMAVELQAIVVASQYRETHEGTGKDEFGGNDVHDVIKLLDFLDLCAFADHDRMVMMGESRGSIMTFEILRVDDRVRAAVVTGSVPDLAAIYDFREYTIQSVLRYRVGGTPEEVPLEYEKRSASFWADEIDVPLLVFHTEDDWRAPIAPVDAFVTSLESLGKDVTYIRQTEGGHCWKDWGIILEFFQENTR